MKFHGITMKGEYKAQTVADVSALVWEASDERRMLYDETTKLIWIATDSEWSGVGINSDIPSTTEMWENRTSTISTTPENTLMYKHGIKSPELHTETAHGIARCR